MTMGPMEGMARAMAQARQVEAEAGPKVGHTLALRRTYATIIDEMPSPSGKRGYDTAVLQRMRRLCGAEVPHYYLFINHQPWDELAAEDAAWTWLSSRINESAPLLLLGRRVCKAFGIPNDLQWLEWYRSPQHGHPMIAFPHPTRSRWLRDHEMEAGFMAANVAHNRLPNMEWKSKEEDA